jgi:4'-phosphopantetheinyl transferase
MFTYQLAFAHALAGVRVGQSWPGLLSPREEQILAGLSFLPRRRKWLLGRAAAKALFAVLPATREMPASEISVLNDPSGAPYALMGEDRWPYCLSLSHRSEVGLAVAATEVGTVLGADVETIEPRDPALPRQFFTPRELAWAQTDEQVALIWSAKEAVLKLLGVGLRLDTRKIEISMGAGECGMEGWSPLGVALASDVAWNGAIQLVWRVEAGNVITVAWGSGL